MERVPKFKLTDIRFGITLIRVSMFGSVEPNTCLSSLESKVEFGSIDPNLIPWKGFPGSWVHLNTKCLVVTLMLKVFIVKYPKLCNKKIQPMKIHQWVMVLISYFSYLDPKNLILVCGLGRSNVDHLLKAKAREDSTDVYIIWSSGFPFETLWILCNIPWIPLNPIWFMIQPLHNIPRTLNCYSSICKNL